MSSDMVHDTPVQSEARSPDGSEPSAAEETDGDNYNRRAICIRVTINNRWGWLEDKEWELAELHKELRIPDGFELWSINRGSQHPVFYADRPWQNGKISPGSGLYLVDRREQKKVWTWEGPIQL